MQGGRGIARAIGCLRGGVERKPARKRTEYCFPAEFSSQRCNMPAGPTNVSRSVTALTGLRGAIGVLFLLFAEYKVFESQFIWGGGMENWIHHFLHEGAYPFMIPVLGRVVLPHAHLLAFMVAYGELAIGLSLTFGILVRPASVCGLIYMLVLLFASNYPGSHAPFWEYFGASLDHSVLALCFAAFAFARPEEILSIRRSRSSPDSHRRDPSDAG